MDSSASALCLLLLVLAVLVGNRKNHLYLIGLILVFLLFVGGLQSTTPPNLFEQARVKPDFKSSLGIRLALRNLEKTGKQPDLLAALKPLVNDTLRARYIQHGPRGLTKLRDENDSFEYLIKLAGPSVAWYAVSFVVVLAFSFSVKANGVIPWGLGTWTVLVLLELQHKSEHSINASKAHPFTTLYEQMDLYRVFGTFFFSLSLYYFHYTYEDKRSLVLELFKTIPKDGNKFIMKRE